MKEQQRKTDAAVEESKKLPKGICVGKLFTVPVADGCAFYEVMSIGKLMVNIIWRPDLHPDQYRDLVLGDGGKFPKVTIERIILQRGALDEAFSKR